MRRWYAVQTKPRREDTAECNLQRQCYETYLPKILLRKLKRGKWSRAIEPLFPRYLFIQVDADQDSLAPVRSTLGVTGLVRFGHSLKPVPDSVIEYLKQAENPETRQHHADDWPHQPGDAVQILEGAFAGLTAVFQSITGEDRATLLIELLGRQNTIGINMNSIAKTA